MNPKWCNDINQICLGCLKIVQMSKRVLNVHVYNAAYLAHWTTLNFETMHFELDIVFNTFKWFETCLIKTTLSISLMKALSASHSASVQCYALFWQIPGCKRCKEELNLILFKDRVFIIPRFAGESVRLISNSELRFE